jgi:two-component system LytT family sensor kinase
VAFIDDYLDIEVIRFGPDKLRVNKELDPDTLDFIVPSMLLQPLVENSIKHGLAPKIDGGTITIRSRIMEDKLVLEVQDDGVGLTGGSESVFIDRSADNPGQSGIGMANVMERLKVLYGDAASMTMTAPDVGEGTLVRLEVPTLETGLARSAADRIYSERSRTRA